MRNLWTLQKNLPTITQNKNTSVTEHQHSHLHVNQYNHIITFLDVRQDYDTLHYQFDCAPYNSAIR